MARHQTTLVIQAIRRRGPTNHCSRSCGRTALGLNGSVDGDPGVQIDMHIFVDSKAPWDHIGGNAPQFAEFPPPRSPEWAVHACIPPNKTLQARRRKAARLILSVSCALALTPLDG